ncbi:hypothetical protein [Octadecabacter antarcticus]|nr:hypothetical protein [Octadecabacter antarcticus]
MRHDELRALVHKYFKNALATQRDRLDADGPMSARELAPVETSQALAEASEEEFWSICTQKAQTPSCGNSARPVVFLSQKPLPTLQE